jgi:ATPase subunit of ABC transporter with duplicated ATPase domains
MVSHDRYLLNKLADQILYLDGEGHLQWRLTEPTKNSRFPRKHRRNCSPQRSLAVPTPKEVLPRPRSRAPRPEVQQERARKTKESGVNFWNRRFSELKA